MHGHLMQYGKAVILLAVLRAVSLTSPSSPQLNITETFIKLSGDADEDTAHNAIFAMGVLGLALKVGAGPNNASLLVMPRWLVTYHHEDQVAPLKRFLQEGSAYV
ncbi:unnamed protein product [Angiostrongylus costaricensis]|uniref:Anaphase-promoting complex subunit 1 n=1 Tax=Angiostrongylus costaricensis TaxID=334426 RepID=A0A0R3PS46_ANGCS|nr:unnamed protein product [Angiostrongylus costaricensis]